MIDFRMRSFFENNFPFPWNDSWGLFAPYMDIGAFLLTIILTIVLAIAVKEEDCSSIFSNSCLFKENTENWRLTVDQIPRNQSIVSAGHGGL